MFLGMSQASYDMELKELQDTFHEIVVHILSRERSSSVKRTLLMVSAPHPRVKLIAGGTACCVLRYTNTHTHTHQDITRLCIFFGRFKTETTLLLHLITFVNEHSDWQLRCAFFHNIVGVAAFVGDKSLELYILPCIEQALAGTASFSRTRRAHTYTALTDLSCVAVIGADEEEFVIDKAINCMGCLCELGLFRKPILINIAQKTTPMLFHPNTWIRFGTPPPAPLSSSSCLTVIGPHSHLVTWSLGAAQVWWRSRRPSRSSSRGPTCSASCSPSSDRSSSATSSTSPSPTCSRPFNRRYHRQPSLSSHRPPCARCV